MLQEQGSLCACWVVAVADTVQCRQALCIYKRTHSHSYIDSTTMLSDTYVSGG